MDEQRIFAADILDIAGGRGRNPHRPAAVGALQVHRAVIDLKVPAVGTAGAGDAVPLGNVPDL